jgi:hypothetical protein
MLPTRRLRRLAAGVAAAALGAVAACTTDSTAPGPSGSNSPALSAPEASLLGEAVAADAQSVLDGATLSSGLFLPGLASPIAPFASGTAFCAPTRSPSPPANSDADPVPDSVRIAFTGCAFASATEADTVRGTIDIIDPTPTTTDRSVKTVFTDLAWVHVSDGRRRSLELNGTRETIRDASVISQIEKDFKSTYTFPDGSTASHDRTWNSTFTAATPGSIQPDAPLPSGTLSIDGTSTWTRGTNTYSLVVSTDPVLHYNADCTMRPKFDSGTLHVTVMRNGTTSNVTIAFTACGQYTVTRS